MSLRNNLLQDHPLATEIDQFYNNRERIAGILAVQVMPSAGTRELADFKLSILLLLNMLEATMLSWGAREAARQGFKTAAVGQSTEQLAKALDLLSSFKFPFHCRREFRDFLVTAIVFAKDAIK